MTTLPKISPEIIKAYQDEISKNSSSATARRKAISLKRFFNWAEGNGKIQENPLQATVSSDVTSIKPKTSKIGIRTWATLGITGALAVLIFLLIGKLKLPIPFKINLAQESTTNVIGNQTPSTSIPANGAVIAGWNLFTKLRITSADGSPQIGSQSISFKIYNSNEGGSPLYSSDPQTITTDADGTALISLNAVPTDLFFQNNQLFIEPQFGSTSASIRIPVATANTATNLNGYPAANPNIGAGPETIPVIGPDGSLKLASQSPSVKATEGNLLVEGQAVTIKATDGSGKGLEFNPDGQGIAHFLFEGSRGNFLNAQGPNLTSGSLFYGMVPNNAIGYDLIKLQSGAPRMTTRFSVDALGNTYTGGNLSVAGDIFTGGVDRLTSEGQLTNITGYYQPSGNFAILQNAENYAAIIKNDTALSDVLTLTLDEDMIAGSHYSTLTLNRFGGDINSRALTVNGNSEFNGQVQLGNFTGNPVSIGEGSVYYNSTDNLIYYWDGSAWQSLGTAVTTPFSLISSGTNTAATMIVGTGASLSTSGTGTITASNVACAGCITNAKLANSSITINSSGILSGGGAVSLGGTLNLAATEADTLASVVTRGPSTNDQVSLNGGITSTGDLTLSPVGDINFYSAANNIDSTGNLTIAGDTTFEGLTYTWPGSAIAGRVLQVSGVGPYSLDWVDPTAAVSSTIYWTSAEGALFPKIAHWTC